ncbi:pentapeptide repeat-containing protein [Chroococcidiopsis sp.]|uniref:pentapeptide repeat-containing protein n=1 Tax=Chroococcidiopsis sp. TaxID=3088168 RepID=UPI003F35AFCC
MANSSVRRNANRARRSVQAESKPLPLATRRFAAWAVEVSLIALSGLIPYSLGEQAKLEPSGEQVTPNPVVALTQKAIASTLTIPAEPSDRRLVTPLTNIFWSVAVVTPLLVGGWQLYLLGKTGSTLPKRWLGVRVVSAAGTVPGLSRIAIRETLGMWGLPLSVAYIMWRATAFPHVGIFFGLSCFFVLGEGMTARFHRQRRCWHDLIAGTYVVDANRAMTILPGTRAKQLIGSREQGALRCREQGAGSASVQGAGSRGLDNSPSPRLQPQPSVAKSVTNKPKVRRSWWQLMRQHPNVLLFLAFLSCMVAVLGTLIGIQIYIQAQKYQRQLAENKSTQFLTLLQYLDASGTTLSDRQRAILALGTIGDPQVLQLLVDLLGQEQRHEIIGTVQQALVSSGSSALPYLQRLNQSIANEIAAGRYSSSPTELARRTQHLQATQQAIGKIFAVYGGRLQGMDLSRVNLAPSTSQDRAFTLELERVNFAGVAFKGANLNRASLPASQWRDAGADRHWDTFDDAIANLNHAQMKGANLTKANLSRVPMERIELMQANLNQANLSAASLGHANLSSAQLVGANLQAATLVDASLTGANLSTANLSDVNLHAARLSRVSALGTRLQSANLTKSNWQGADLSSADLSHSNLSHADLSLARLSSSSLSHAQMQNINLRQADLRMADLRGANLAGADFQGTILFSPQPPASGDRFIATPPEYTQAALVQGVNFSQVKNLDAQQIAYICVYGGYHPRCP